LGSAFRGKLAQVDELWDMIENKDDFINNLVGELFTAGPSVETHLLPEDFDKEAMHEIQHMFNETILEIALPYIAELEEYRDNMDVVTLYIKQALGLIKQSEFNKEAADLGFEIHERNENGEVKIPSLNQFMPEIIEAFTGYLRDKLPAMFGGPENFDQERL
jgi:hypothetical protein